MKAIRLGAVGPARWRPISFAAAAVGVPALMAACGAGGGSNGDSDVDMSQSPMDTVGRRIFGPGAEYVATAREQGELAEALAKSMQERRAFGWSIVERAVKMVNVASLTQPIPTFMTWYTPDELTGFFQGVIKQLSPERREQIRADLAAGRKPTLPSEEVRQAMSKAAASSPTNMTEAEFAALLRRIHESDGGQPGSGMQHRGFTGQSTSLVRHAFENFGAIVTCDFNSAPPDLDLMGAPSFSHCIPEFPKDAVMFKTRWQRVDAPIQNFDMSADGFTKAWRDGDFPKVSGAEQVPVPGPDGIYRITDRDGVEWALSAVHFVTKETREWVWVSLSWSGTPNDDLGQDRPASIPAPFNHYKMTVTSKWLEGDPTPWIGADGREIAALRTLNGLKRAEEPTLTTWGSDPHIEIRDPKSNCIGCHGGSFSGNTQVRKNFPGDFAFSVPQMRFQLTESLKREGLWPAPDAGSGDAGPG